MTKQYGMTIWFAAAAESFLIYYLTDITSELERQTGFSIDGYDLKVQYICPAMSSK